MFDSPVEAYCRKFSSQPSSLLSELERTTYMRSVYPKMLSGALQGRLLSFISKLVSPKKILEIGTFTGYSALCLAEGLQADGELITVDSNPEIESIALHFFARSPYSNQIKFVLADATQFLTETHSVYDLIFLDADKRAYLNYFNLLISHTQIGSLILADNVLWGGKVLDLEKNQDRDTQAVHDFNIAVSEDVRFEKVILPIRDGLTLIQRVR